MKEDHTMLTSCILEYLEHKYNLQVTNFNLFIYDGFLLLAVNNDLKNL